MWDLVSYLWNTYDLKILCYCSLFFLTISLLAQDLSIFWAPRSGIYHWEIPALYTPLTVLISTLLSLLSQSSSFVAEDSLPYIILPCYSLRTPCALFLSWHGTRDVKIGATSERFPADTYPTRILTWDRILFHGLSWETFAKLDSRFTLQMIIFAFKENNECRLYS